MTQYPPIPFQGFSRRRQSIHSTMKAMRRILLGLLIFGIAELYLLIAAGSYIGALGVVLLILATAAWGGWLIRCRGLACTQKMRTIMRYRELPPLALMEGSFLVFAGIFLIIPGFLTDIIGAVGVIAPLRRWMTQRFLEINLYANPDYSNVTEYQHTVLEGEYKRVDE